jgi:uncharacterized protein YkwD
MWSAFALIAAVLALEAPVPVNGRCPDGRVWTSSAADQTQMLGLLNQARARQRRPALRRDTVLDRMAMAHAADMACRNYFDHRNREREKLPQRYARIAGREATEWQRLAEILGTSPTPVRQLERWLDSRSHRSALLEARHDAVGVGLVRIARGSRYTTYWAAEFMASDD